MPFPQLKKPGFYLGFDRCNPLMSPASEDNIVSLVMQGYGDRVMLSHDCIFMWAREARDSASAIRPLVPGLSVQADPAQNQSGRSDG